MKTTGLCLLVILGAALLSGPAYAAPPDNNGPEPKLKTEERTDGRKDVHTAAKGRPAIHSPVLAAKRPLATAKDKPASRPGDPAAIHPLSPVRPGSALSRARTRPGLSHSSVQEERMYQALPVRPGAQSSPGIAASIVRHRDPNAAVIGGRATSNRTAAALDGSQVKIKSSRN
jgi:hypothetical protein